MSELNPASRADPTNPVELHEDEWYYDRERSDLFAVRENAIRFDPDATAFTGELTAEATDGGVATYEGAMVAEWVVPNAIFHVSDRVVDDPQRVVVEYGAVHIREDEAILGKDHDYDGIEGVQRIRDLSLALVQLDDDV